MSTTKRILSAAESRMTAKDRGMFTMPPEEIRRLREVLYGNPPPGTDPAHVARLKQLQAKVRAEL